MRALAIAHAAGAVVFAACSLDLDEGLLAPKDGGAGDASVESGPGGGAGDGGSAGSMAGSAGTGNAAGTGATGGIGPIPDAGACDGAGTCVVPDNGCLVGQCVAGECVYDICPGAGACESSVCDTTTKTCSAPAAYSFHAHEFSVGDGLVCGDPRHCVAALGDFVVAATSGGVRAWRVLSARDPQSVAVDQPPFAVLRIAVSGDRLLLLGPTAGGKLSLAWIDRPTTPLVSTLAATSVAVSFTGTIDHVFPAAGDGFFLVKHNEAEAFPTALIQLPLTSTSTVTQVQSPGITAGSVIVGASGTKLLAFRVETGAGTFNPMFSFENDAGTVSAQNGGESPLAVTDEVPPALGAHQFMPAPGGALLWTTNRVVRIDVDNAESQDVRFLLPLAEGETALSATRSVALENYVPAQGINANLAGPAAQIDTETFLVTAADPSNVAQTAVRLVKRAGDTLTLDTSKRWVLSVAPTAIAAFAGPRFGFVLVPAAPLLATQPSVHVFDPACN